ncbi:hypothetical protein TRFO_04388 [Tritrichomonas foetus]|uniref:Uncharacterized protein n=1 Tax=Tritrichomonas foetus TaxID=1144522 RepID=A0A1J4KFA5_9EUKA|nr:hypothetical protein TRFO_04388 [Tritrichomonas foetus]|eukprot:OHT09859.1 hypothetical protein TRFO_04388 [Tritrichomonas foetus]
MDADDTPKHELISYNKKFKPGTAGVKLSFAPDEMAFSREDMPLRAAIARREVLLTLQPQIDGVTKKKWCNDVLVFNPKEPFNPQNIYVTRKNEKDPDFRRDFYDPSLPWDDMGTINPKLEAKQFRKFTADARMNTIKKCQPLSNTPLLVTRQIQYAKMIKENGIPAAQPPPPFIVKKPKMSKVSNRFIHKADQIEYFHDGVYIENEALGGKAWSCCGNMDEHSAGCRKKRSNKYMTLYDNL